MNSGWFDAFFYLYAAIACGFGVAVLLTSNVVRMAFFLVISLGATAGLFFLAGAEFVGAMQLMIYVGGTLVLLIFGVMLTAQQRFISMKTPAGHWILSAGVGGALLFLLMASAFSVADWREPNPNREQLAVEENKTVTQIGFALSGFRVDLMEQVDEILRGGMSGYLLPFIIVSVHLLVVLIGAAYMARAKRVSGTAGPAVPLDISDKKRNVITSLWLWAFLTLDLGFAFLALLYPQVIRELPAVGKYLADTSDSFMFGYGVALAVQGFCVAAVLGWSRWGVWGIILTAVVQLIVAATNNIGLNGVAVIAIDQVIAAFGTVGVLMLGRPSSWSQLE